MVDGTAHAASRMPKSHLELTITAGMLTELEIESARTWPKETGGILVGYRHSSNQIFVTHVIGPGPKAIHGSASFMPDSDFHYSELDHLYVKTNGASCYLGDCPISMEKLRSTVFQLH
jgi:integrative and conjugative element protein (TIGR02256 family)